MAKQQQLPKGKPSLDWLTLRNSKAYTRRPFVVPLMMVASLGDLKLFCGPTGRRSVGYTIVKGRKVPKVWWWWTIKRDGKTIVKQGEQRRSRAQEAAETYAVNLLLKEQRDAED